MSNKCRRPNVQLPNIAPDQSKHRWKAYLTAGLSNEIIVSKSLYKTNTCLYPGTSLLKHPLHSHHCFYPNIGRVRAFLFLGSWKQVGSLFLLHSAQTTMLYSATKSDSLLVNCDYAVGQSMGWFFNNGKPDSRKRPNLRPISLGWRSNVNFQLIKINYNNLL